MRKFRRPLHPSKLNSLSIQAKANKVLHLIVIILMLILIRLWFLSIADHDRRLENTKRPQRRVIIEKAERGTIRDRFNIPLAINKLQYNAGVAYSQIKEIPSISWEKDASGIRIKRYKRKEHIKQLSQLLAQELDMDPQRIEDLIHAKAALVPNIPFTLKEGITEKQYFRLKMQERDWPGIVAQKVPKREYPQEKVAADVVGYLGRINKQEYDQVMLQIRQLRDYIESSDEEIVLPLPKSVSTKGEVRTKLRQLEERAYTINDYIGKTGIESRFEEILRGYRGKKIYQSDARGKIIRPLPGSQDSLPGQRILLTISKELQEYAEQLLIENEDLREDGHPWIKGGAIVVMEPITGEILCLASYPRFNPNDFISSTNLEENQLKTKHINQWLENSLYIADLWDQKQSLTREKFSPSTGLIGEESLILTWTTYLDFILPTQHPVRLTLNKMNGLRDAIEIQRLLDELLYLTGKKEASSLLNALYSGNGHLSHGDPLPIKERKALQNALKESEQRVAVIKERLDPFFLPLKLNFDKLLLADLCKVAVNAELVIPSLIKYTDKLSLTDYRNLCAAYATLQTTIKSGMKNLFRQYDFKIWREANEKSYLKEKRIHEDELGLYHRPFIDYLDAQEKELFQLFWQKYRISFLLYFLADDPSQSTVSNDLSPYMHWLDHLKRTLEGSNEVFSSSYRLLSESLKIFEKADQFAFLKTLRTFDDLTRPLYGCYPMLIKKGEKTEKDLASAFYPSYGFGYGRSAAFRQSTQQGSIFKLVTAYEALRQKLMHQSSTGSSLDLNPLTIIDEMRPADDISKWNLGFTTDGKAIPQFYKGGRLPRSHKANIGRVDIIGAIEASSNPYFALLAGDHIENPEDLVGAAETLGFGHLTGIDLPGEIAGKLPQDVSYDRTGLYALAIGQHSLVVTPLQTAVMLSAIANGGQILKPRIVALTAGKNRNPFENPFIKTRDFPFRELLSSVGIHFSLFCGTRPTHSKTQINSSNDSLVREIQLPESIQNLLLTGMRQVIVGNKGIGPPSRIKTLQEKPKYLKTFLDMRPYFVGKTSTAEVLERTHLNLKEGVKKVKHVWFGGIAYEDPIEPALPPMKVQLSSNRPEIVIVVYLRYGNYGKEAAPIAMQLLQKWREIKKDRY